MRICARDENRETSADAATSLVKWAMPGDGRSTGEATAGAALRGEEWGKDETEELNARQAAAMLG